MAKKTRKSERRLKKKLSRKNIKNDVIDELLDLRRKNLLSGMSRKESRQVFKSKFAELNLKQSDALRRLANALSSLKTGDKDIETILATTTFLQDDIPQEEKGNYHIISESKLLQP